MKKNPTTHKQGLDGRDKYWTKLKNILLLLKSQIKKAQIFPFVKGQ